MPETRKSEQGVSTTAAEVSGVDPVAVDSVAVDTSKDPADSRTPIFDKAATKMTTEPEPGLATVAESAAERDISFEVDITRVCVRTGAVRLPHAVQGLFERKTDLVVRSSETKSEYVLSFIPPRILNNLEAFFKDSSAKANDKIKLRLNGTRGEIWLQKRQVARHRGRRDPLETGPTKHELLAAAEQRPRPQTEPKAPPVPIGPKSPAEPTLEPKAQPTQPTLQPAPQAAVSEVSVKPAPVAASAEPEVASPRPSAVPTVLPDTAPGRYRPETGAPVQNDSGKRPEPAATASAQPPQAATVSGPAASQGRARPVVPSGIIVGDDDLPPMPEALETDPQMDQDEAVRRDLLDHLNRPSTPAILRVEDVAEVLSLSPDSVARNLISLSEGEDAPVRYIRNGVFQILRRDVAAL